MADALDPEHLTKQQTADALQVTTRTVEQLVKDGKLDPRRWRPPEGGQWRVVFLAEDVARLAAERQGAPPTPFLVPGLTGPPNGNAHAESRALRIASSRTPSLDDLVRVILAMAQRALTGTPSAEGAKDPKGAKGPKGFLTLAEAASEFGLSEPLLRREMRQGTLPYKREPRSQWTAEDRGWRIRRKDLEAL